MSHTWLVAGLKIRSSSSILFSCYPFNETGFMKNIISYSFLDIVSST